MFQKASLNRLIISRQMPANNSHCCGLRFEKNTNHWRHAHWWIADDYATTAPAVHDVLENHTFVIESTILYFSCWLSKLLFFSYSYSQRENYSLTYTSCPFLPSCAKQVCTVSRFMYRKFIYTQIYMLAQNCKTALNGAYGIQVETVIQAENKTYILWAL